MVPIIYRVANQLGIRVLHDTLAGRGKTQRKYALDEKASVELDPLFNGVLIYGESESIIEARALVLMQSSGVKLIRL